MAWIRLGGNETVITNSGTINGVGLECLTGNYCGTGYSEIINYGTMINNFYDNYCGDSDTSITSEIDGKILRLVGVQRGTGDATIINSGVVGGSILAGPGDNTVTILPDRVQRDRSGERPGRHQHPELPGRQRHRSG